MSNSLQNKLAGGNAFFDQLIEAIYYGINNYKSAAFESMQLLYHNKTGAKVFQLSLKPQSVLNLD